MLSTPVATRGSARREALPNFLRCPSLVAFGYCEPIDLSVLGVRSRLPTAKGDQAKPPDQAQCPERRPQHAGATSLRQFGGSICRIRRTTAGISTTTGICTTAVVCPTAAFST